jgi:hypothetical protein
MSNAFEFPICFDGENPRKIELYNLPAVPDPAMGCDQFPFDIPLPDPADFSFGCFLPTVHTTATTPSVGQSESSGGLVLGGQAATTGSSITLTAIPYQSWEVDNWTDDLANEFPGTTDPVTGINTLSVTVSSRTYTAHFIRKKTVITVVSPVTGGTANVDGGGTSGSFDIGTNTPINAVANSGYLFSHWTDGNAETSRDIRVTSQAATYTPVFVSESSHAKVSVVAEAPAITSTEVIASVTPTNGDNCQLDFSFDFRLPDFSLLVLPEDFAQVSPADYSEDVPLAPTVTWTVCYASGVDTYRVRMWFEEDLGNPPTYIVDQTVPYVDDKTYLVTSLAITPGLLRPYRSYMWSVEAVTTLGTVVKTASNAPLVFQCVTTGYGSLAASYDGSSPSVTLNLCNEKGAAFVNNPSESDVVMPTGSTASATLNEISYPVNCLLPTGTVLKYTCDLLNNDTYTVVPFLHEPVAVLGAPSLDGGNIKVSCHFTFGSIITTEDTITYAAPTVTVHQVRYNTTTKSFQFQARDIVVLDAGDAGAWTDLAVSKESKSASCTAQAS